ncbi:MAG TPA: hypothetical protein VMT29_01310 [Steroidobacteraceae bacterium]|nr:hypothetical protein [Steroidobacteraceae bacterium]
MSELTWKRLGLITLSVLTVFVACNVLTRATSGYFRREQIYHAELDALAAHRSVHIVFAGDSHFAVPLNDYLNPNLAGPAYSVAFGGDSPRECYAKLRRALELAPSIDTFIIEADPHMFARGRLESSNRSFADWYFIRALDRTGLKHGWAAALLDQVPLFNNDFLQYLRRSIATGIARARGRPGDVRAQENEGAWGRLTEAQRIEEARDTGKGDHAGIGASPEPFYWYGRTVQLAREHHVKVIAVRFPVHPEYAAQAPADQVAAIDAFLLGKGVEQVIDLRTALADPREFEDPDHVNDLGVASLLPVLEVRLGRRLTGSSAGKAAASQATSGQTDSSQAASSQTASR